MKNIKNIYIKEWLARSITQKYPDKVVEVIHRGNAMVLIMDNYRIVFKK